MTSDRRQDMENFIRRLDEARFEKFQAELRHAKEVTEHNAKLLKVRDRRRMALLAAAGIDAKKLQAAEEKLRREEEPELTEALDEVRRRFTNRPSLRADDAKEQAVRAAVLAEMGLISVPIFGASMFVADSVTFRQSPFWTETPPAKPLDEPGSGWYVAADPGYLRAQLDTPGDGKDKHKDIHTDYMFVPDKTGTYDLTVGFGFYGWYYLRAMDSFWTGGQARVQMDLTINVHQFINEWGVASNFFEMNNQQSSTVGVYGLINLPNKAFSKSSQLAAGDPVVVTATITLKAFADGDDHSYAVINFEEGAANYIQCHALVARLVS